MWIAKRVILPFCILVLIAQALAFQAYIIHEKDRLHTMMNGLLFVIVPIVLGIIVCIYWRRFPAITDRLFIRDELKITVWLLALQSALSIIIPALRIVTVQTGKETIPPITLILMRLITNFVILYVLILLPQRKVRRPDLHVQLVDMTASTHKDWQSISYVYCVMYLSSLSIAITLCSVFCI